MNQKVQATQVIHLKLHPDSEHTIHVSTTWEFEVVEEKAAAFLVQLDAKMDKLRYLMESRRGELLCFILGVKKVLYEYSKDLSAEGFSVTYDTKNIVDESGCVGMRRILKVQGL